MILDMEQEESLDSTNEYFKHLGKITRDVDRDETARLWTLARKGNERAKNQIIENNLRLVVPTAKRFLRPGIELMDLIEEGNLGLLQAIEKFEPSKGYRFSTYAVYWTEQYIRKYIEEQSSSIKIPSHAWGHLKRWFRAWNALKEANGRDPSLKEMAQKLKLTARQVKSIVDTLNAARGIDSLASVIHEDEDLTLEEVISDNGKSNPHEMFLHKEDQQKIQQSMADLNDRDRQVVIMRYGLDDNDPKTLGEVADTLGLSRERVRQIEERAIRYLRKEALKAGILEPTAENFRTRKLHHTWSSQVKTNIIGEEKPKAVLARLLRNAKRTEQARLNKKKKATQTTANSHRNKAKTGRTQRTPTAKPVKRARKKK